MDILTIGSASPALPNQLGSGGMLAVAHIPTGATADKGFDINEVKSRIVKPAVARGYVEVARRPAAQDQNRQAAHLPMRPTNIIALAKNLTRPGGVAESLICAPDRIG